MGAVADLANAGLYAAEGDYLNAALSFASAIPGISDTVALAKKSVKAIKGGVKGLKKINALRKAKGMKAILAKMYGKAKTGALNLRKGTKNIDEVLDAVENEIKEICTNGRCFAGDTLVYTSHGYKPIKEIKKGDEIYSRNEKTGETGIKEVEEVFCTTAHTIYHVWVNGKEEFKTTAYHPVYVREQGWIKAINLRKGDAIETMDGFVHITKVEKTRHEEAVPVYNFHVKDWVSYFVGKIRSYVHNGNNHIGNNLGNTLTDAQKSRLNTLENTINDHLTAGDFSGTLRDLQGNPVPNGKGGYWDHLGEMKNSYKSLKKIKRGLEGSLKNPNLSNIDRKLLQDGLNKANSNIDKIEKLFKPFGGIE